MTTLRFSSTLVVFWLLVSGDGYAEIGVAPSDPTTADTVQVTVSGEYGNPCFEVESFSAVGENTIQIYVRIIPRGEICAQVITSWSVTDEIGALPAGNYHVTATIDAPCCFPCNPPPCVEQTFFGVSQLLAVDIKPGSCRNPLNTKGSGVLPVAVMGSAEFDVTRIDVATVRLGGVAPVRSGYADVGFPRESVGGIEDCDLGCAAQAADGWIDLTLKFDTQEVLEDLGEVAGGECRSLNLTGALQEGFGETSITGKDLVLIFEPGGVHTLSRRGRGQERWRRLAEPE